MAWKMAFYEKFFYNKLSSTFIYMCIFCANIEIAMEKNEIQFTQNIKIGRSGGLLEGVVVYSTRRCGGRCLWTTEVKQS